MIVSNEQYRLDFSGCAVNKEAKSYLALEKALDIRKFEIDLYWKRAAYFWAFIAVAFGGYFAVLKSDGAGSSDVFIINCLGLTFSVAWYFANRGSKFWQQNWERHVDELEDAVTGPLYKTILNRKQYRFFPLTGPFAFSVSKINTLLSLFVIFIWLFLAIQSISEILGINECFRGANVLCLTVLTAGGICSLYCYGKTGKRDDETRWFRRGTVSDEVVTGASEVEPAPSA